MTAGSAIRLMKGHVSLSTSRNGRGTSIYLPINSLSLGTRIRPKGIVLTQPRAEKGEHRESGVALVYQVQNGVPKGRPYFHSLSFGFPVRPATLWLHGD